jgi:hypothetical protein
MREIVWPRDTAEAACCIIDFAFGNYGSNPTILALSAAEMHG